MFTLGFPALCVQCVPRNISSLNKILRKGTNGRPFCRYLPPGTGQAQSRIQEKWSFSSSTVCFTFQLYCGCFHRQNSVVSCLSRALGPALHHFGLHASPSSFKRAKSICVAVTEADKVNVTDRSRTLNARVLEGNRKRDQQYTSNFNHLTCKIGFPVCALVVEELHSSGVGT